MSTDEQDRQMGKMMRERQNAQRELACHQGQWQRWQQLWQALSTQEENLLLLTAEYPSQKEVVDALNRMVELHAVIANFNNLLKDCE